jgi:hypothetical protein
MSNKKRKWSEWCHDFVRKTNRCPGEVPAFGLPEVSMTSEEFEQTMAVADLHTWSGNCHFGVKPDEVDPVNGPPAGMKKLVVKEGASGLEDAKNMAAHLGEVLDSQRIISIKKNLHNYVERISLKENGQLVIPAPLLDIKGYIGKFFEVE